MNQEKEVYGNPDISYRLPNEQEMLHPQFWCHGGAIPVAVRIDKKTGEETILIAYESEARYRKPENLRGLELEIGEYLSEKRMPQKFELYAPVNFDTISEIINKKIIECLEKQQRDSPAYTLNEKGEKIPFPEDDTPRALSIKALNLKPKHYHPAIYSSVCPFGWRQEMKWQEKQPR